MWAVAGAALALKRPVRSQDVVESTPEPRLALVGLGLIPVLTPAIAALGERLGLWPLPGDGALRWAGVALVALGLTLRLAAMMQLGPRFSPLVAVQVPSTRSRPGALRAHPASGIPRCVARRARRGADLRQRAGPRAARALHLGDGGTSAEGRGLLAARFGDAWRDYRARTGAFVPRLGGAR